MTIGEDLYREEQCPQCGQKKLKSASFCPHCGYVKKTSWVDKVKEVFSGGAGTKPGSSGMGVSTIVGLAFAGYLLYSAIEDGSIQGIILAVLILFAALQSWYGGRKKAERGVDGDASVQEPEEGVLEDKFFCENCGERVAADAVECPKCGMKFGQG